MKKTNLPFLLGILLFLLSAPPIINFVQEMHYEQKSEELYNFQTIFTPNLEFYVEDNQDFGIESYGPTDQNTMEKGRISLRPGLTLEKVQLIRTGKDKGTFSQEFRYRKNRIEVKDTFPLDLSKDKNLLKIFPETGTSPIEIKINGKDYSNRLPLTIFPNLFDQSRYPYFALVFVENLKTKKESLVLAQANDKHGNNYRFLWISENGKVRAETFNNNERTKKLYRTDIINAGNISPITLGYKGNTVEFYPTLFFPFLYPLLSALAGVFLIIIGGTMVHKK
ncbi:hypothetical protein SAMN04488137_0439 [Fictibacillus solisalsi]|uniref:Uncharacterized protein n=1 Tax=Fictibacillus solisalsi TaxID=459525 RepID=A0A1G9TQX0_9BACL|nr:hypothetical protein [Fictibacillus solisalsi]SDM50083.1 hypothetical protein SAMN04488137_0439 [Fictibacillus solisalsi]